MRITVTRNTDKLHREEWEFTLLVGGTEIIYFDRYTKQFKDKPSRRKWQTAARWDRLYDRSNTIADPPFPLDVENEARETFGSHVMQLPIKGR